MRNFVSKRVFVLLFLSAFLFGTISLALPQKVFAFVCEQISSDDNGIPSGIYNISGFASEQELRDSTVRVVPTSNPGCLLVHIQDISLSGAQVGENDDGTFFTFINLSQPTSSLPESCYPLTIHVFKDGAVFINDLCTFKVNNPLDYTVPFNLCDSVPNGDKRKQCMDCVGVEKGEDAKKIWTALGCITVDESKGKYGAGIITALIRIGLGIAGGALLLMILASAFLLSTSGGDPKKTEEAQQMITSGVVGLLFIIFSVVILRTIGIDILQIPGF